MNEKTCIRMEVTLENENLLFYFASSLKQKQKKTRTKPEKPASCLVSPCVFAHSAPRTAAAPKGLMGVSGGAFLTAR